MKKQNNVDVIFDNGGCIIIQTDGYVHTYRYDPEEAAHDYYRIIQGACPIRDKWDGNENEWRIEYDGNEVSRGDYVWATYDDVLHNLKTKYYEYSGMSNEEEFYEALEKYNV